MLYVINTLASVEITDPSEDTVRTVDEGDVVTFTCTARGVPPPSITWYLEGEQVMNTSRVMVVPLSEVSVDEEGYSSVTSMIIVSTILRSDTGIGSCIANNIVTMGTMDMRTKATRLVNITVQCKRAPPYSRTKTPFQSHHFYLSLSLSFSSSHCN